MPANPIPNVEDLKAWLAKKLEPICDADPVPLAKYVVALAKKDKPKDELKTFCNDQLEVFLQNATAKFVDELFEALGTKSYIPNYVPPVTEIQPPLPSYEPALSLPPDAPPLPPEETQPEPPVVSSTNDDIEPPTQDDSQANTAPSQTEQPATSTGDKGRRSRSKSPSNRNHSPRNRSRSPRKSRSPSPRRGRRDDDRRLRRDDRDHYDRRGGPYRGSRDYRDRYGQRRGEIRRGEGGRERYEGRPHRDDNDRYGNSRRHNSPLRKTPPPSTSISSVVTVPPHSVQGRPRCRDFDEKGFCMKGELCPYDHGVDPVIVEDLNLPTVLGIPQQQNNKPPPPLPPMPLQPPLPPLPVPDMSAMGPIQLPMPRPPGFGCPPTVPFVPPGAPHDPRFGPSEPAPPGTGLHLPLPKPPPVPFPNILPNPGQFQPRSEHFTPPPPVLRHDQEYNPEAPGMDDNMSAVYNRVPHRVPSSNLRTLVDIKPAEPSSEDKDEKERSQPSVAELRTQETEGTVYEKEKPTSSERIDSRRFVMDPKPADNSAQTNENVNSNSNKVPDLREKLSASKQTGRKFIPNNRTLEVKKIPRELNTIAKLNEHFQKFGTIVNLQVAFNRDPSAALITFATHPQAKNAHNSTDAILNNRFIRVFWHSPETQTNDPSSTEKHHIKERVVIPPKSQLTVVRKHPSEKLKQPVVQATGSGLTKTVYNTDALKTSEELAKSAIEASKKLAQAKEAMNKKKEEARKLALHKQMMIQKQKQELMKEMIQKQKDLIAKLESQKSSLSAESKSAIMSSLKMLTASIEKTKKELTLSKISAPKSKAEAQKELLDTELELYNQQSEGADTSELRKRVVALRKEAHALGLLNRGGGRGGRGGIVGRGRGRGRGIIQRRRSSRMKTVLDKRPRELQITGFSAEEKDEVLVYLNEFGEFDHIDYRESSNEYILRYKTRAEAEMAVTKGSLFKGKQLMMSWHVPQEEKAPQNEEELTNSSFEDAEGAQEEDDDSFLIGDDDDEEEDTESRAWRR